jgi:Leucine-rich repeat (LRR) protein
LLYFSQLDTLKILNCNNNKLISLPENLPIFLEILDCSDNNPIETIHQAISRFLNKIKHQTQTVYTDKQSVQNGNVQESIRQSIVNILSTQLD